jgi:hypothetical protein
VAQELPHVFVRRLFRSEPYGLSRVCACSTTIRGRRAARALARTAIATWRSCPTCSKASSHTRTAWVKEHVLGPNEVQAMSAGSGVIHSEFNALRDRADALLPDLAHPGDARHQAVVSAVRLRPE